LPFTCYVLLYLVSYVLVTSFGSCLFYILYSVLCVLLSFVKKCDFVDLLVYCVKGLLVVAFILILTINLVILIHSVGIE